MVFKGRDGKLKSVEELLKRSMPPKFQVWEKFEEAAQAWESVVGPALCKLSAPLDIAGGELVVMAKTPHAGSRIVMMGGNISRILAERWGLEVSRVKVVVGQLPLNASYNMKDSKTAYRGGVNRAASIRVQEQEVKEFAERRGGIAPDCPEDAAEALGRLRAFFIKRFPRT